MIFKEIIFITSVIFFLTSCGGGGQSTEQSNKPKQVVEQKPVIEPEESTKPEEEPKQIYTEPVTIIVIQPEQKPSTKPTVKPIPEPVVEQPEPVVEQPEPPENSTSYSKGFVGTFIDSPVIGLYYWCDQTLKQTDENGNFNCDTTPIDFYVGNLKIGRLDKIPDDFLVFPQDLVKQPRAAAIHPDVIKMVTLLLSLDVDRDPNNGIYIAYSTVHKLNQIISQGTDLEDMSLTVLIETLDEIVEENYIFSKRDAENHILKTMSKTYESPIQP